MLISATILAGSSIDRTIREAIAICGALRSKEPMPLDRNTDFYDIKVLPDPPDPQSVQVEHEGRTFSVATDGSSVISFQFEFNGVTVTIRQDSDYELIYRDWQRALYGYIDKNVGPYPNPVLTDEEKENDARVEAENERRRQQRQDEYEAAATAKRNATEAKLASAPPMELSNPDGWRQFDENNQDPYGHGVVVFAERWARLMQVEMASGKSLEEVASSTSHEADTDGITGFMYGAAVSTLAQTWKYGDQLRRWHNLDTQLGDEGERANESGGVLNPAMLNIG